MEKLVLSVYTFLFFVLVFDLLFLWNMRNLLKVVLHMCL